MSEYKVIRWAVTFPSLRESTPFFHELRDTVLANRHLDIGVYNGYIPSSGKVFVSAIGGGNAEAVEGLIPLMSKHPRIDLPSEVWEALRLRHDHNRHQGSHQAHHEGGLPLNHQGRAC